MAELSAWEQMIEDMNSGNEVRVDREHAEYFLECLPPVHMYYTATFNDGTSRPVWFGFAEGAELVIAFWEHPTEKDICLCRQTTEMNPYG